MIRLRVKGNNMPSLYIGQFLNKLHHTSIKSACVFKTYDDAVFVVKDWTYKVYPRTGINEYDVEEI